MVSTVNIKATSKEDAENLDKQMILILDLIKTKFGGLTIPEVKEAFRMYVSHELEIKVFRLLDCIAVGEILNAYIEFRAESLRIYNSKKTIDRYKEDNPELSKEEIQKTMYNAVLICYSEFLENGKVDDFKFYIFDVLYKIGVLPKIDESEAVKNAYAIKKAIAIDQLKPELGIKKSKALHTHEKNEIIQQIKNVNKGDDSSIDSRVKCLVLAGFFTKIQGNQKCAITGEIRLKELLDANFVKYD